MKEEFIGSRYFKIIAYATSQKEVTLSWNCKIWHSNTDTRLEIPWGAWRRYERVAPYTFARVDRMLEASREIIISHQNSVKSPYFLRHSPGSTEATMLSWDYSVSQTAYIPICRDIALRKNIDVTFIRSQINKSSFFLSQHCAKLSHIVSRI